MKNMQNIALRGYMEGFKARMTKQAFEVSPLQAGLGGAGLFGLGALTRHLMGGKSAPETAPEEEAAAATEDQLDPSVAEAQLQDMPYFDMPQGWYMPQGQFGGGYQGAY